MNVKLIIWISIFLMCAGLVLSAAPAGKATHTTLYADTIEPKTSNDIFVNGNLGIGTNTPKGLLEIASSTYINTNTWTCNTGDTAIEYSTNAKTCTGSAICAPNNKCTTGSHGWTSASTPGSNIQESCDYSDGSICVSKKCYATPNVKCKKSIGSSFVVSGVGSVGIGTTTPGAKLEIKSDGSNALLLRVLNSFGNNLMLLRQDSSGNAQFDLSQGGGSANIRFSTVGDSFINSGNVGIGISNPTRKLHVVGDSNLDGNLDVKKGISFDPSTTYVSGYTGYAYNVVGSTTVDLGKHSFCALGRVLHDGGNGGQCWVYYDSTAGVWKMYVGKWLGGGIGCQANCMD